MAWAQAAGIEPVNADLVTTDDGYALSADFNIDLGPRVAEAVFRGIPLYFNMELEVVRPRWYWTNEHMISYKLTYRLSYQALTRHYRIATGTLHRSFDTLDDALRALGHISALPVAEKGALAAGIPYQASLRLTLDRDQLPKPFQVDAIANKDWQVDAKTLHWHYPTVDRDAK
jgi:hypothetical protein